MREHPLAEVAYNAYDTALPFYDSWQAVADAVVAAHEARRWRPIAEWAEDWRPILRPHIIHGAMDVTRRVILGEKRWINGDMTTYWPDDAFAPYWMPRPEVPSEWMQSITTLPAPPKEGE